MRAGQVVVLLFQRQGWLFGPGLFDHREVLTPEEGQCSLVEAWDVLLADPTEDGDEVTLQGLNGGQQFIEDSIFSN